MGAIGLYQQVGSSTGVSKVATCYMPEVNVDGSSCAV